MPYTAIRIARLVGDLQFDMKNLSDPAINIGYGAYYFQKLIRYYHNNAALAVAAYNAGPVAVNRWLETCGNCEVDEFVEAIPYRETRRYVKSVMRYYAHYAQIYDEQVAIRVLPDMPLQLPEGEEIF
jgi:soluble lytic murein transglycosylase